MDGPTEEWPSPLLLKLSKRFYEERIKFFSTPEDIPWEELDKHDQEAYAFAGIPIGFTSRRYPKTC